MSASNWRECPRCKTKALAQRDAARGRAARAYGKVSADKYAKLLALASAEVDVGESLREDYQIGMSSDGVFYVSYRGECQQAGCRFQHTFEHEDKRPI